MLAALFFLYLQRIHLLWVNSVRRGEGILRIKLILIEAVDHKDRGRHIKLILIAMRYYI
jgi:hypothetical protein